MNGFVDLGFRSLDGKFWEWRGRRSYRVRRITSTKIHEILTWNSFKFRVTSSRVSSSFSSSSSFIFSRFSFSASFILLNEIRHHEERNRFYRTKKILQRFCGSCGFCLISKWCEIFSSFFKMYIHEVLNVWKGYRSFPFFSIKSWP